MPEPVLTDDPFDRDVQRRVPDVNEPEGILGLRATTSLDDMLDEVIPWISEEITAGRM